MNIFSRLYNAFSSEPSSELILAAHPDDKPDANLPTGEVAWSEDAMLNMGDAPKYNPDRLIGVKGAGIYRKMMLDEQVKAVVRFKRDAITSRDYFFEVPENDTLSTEETEQRIKLCDHIISKMKGSFMDSLNGIMTAVWQGFSITEKNTVLIDFEGLSYWGLDTLKVKPFDTFTFKVDEFGNSIALIQNANGQEQELDLDKFLHFVNAPELDAQYGSSELREAYRSWFSKDMAVRFYNMWLERHASGFCVIQATGDKSIKAGTPEYTSLQNVLKNSVNGAGLILPSGIEFKVHYPTNNVAYKEAMDIHDLGIARAMLVPNLMGITPAGQTGSFSQSDTQLDAFLWTLDADATRLIEVLNEQLFRQLGEANFGDDLWPRIKFKPISEKRKMQLIGTWKDLVTAGAVQATDTDEAHIRDLLDMPSKPEPEEDEDNVSNSSASTALNGGQVTSMLALAELVATGMLNKETAVQLLIVSFPVSRRQASAIIDPIVVKEVKDENKPLGNVGTVLPDDDTSAGDNLDGAGNDLPSDNDDTGDVVDDKELAKDDDKAKKEETVLGVGIVSVSAFTTAAKRVDFAVIDNASENIATEYVDKTTDVLDLITADLIAKAKSGGPLNEDITKNLEAMVVDNKLKRKLNAVQNAMLKEAHAIGVKHAASEIDKAKKSENSRYFKMDRVNYIAADYFKVNAFKITGDLTNTQQSIIEQSILNGAKYDKTWGQVEEDIYQTLATKGRISEEAARAALGDALGVANTTARLNTIIHTSTFDAINNARHSYFTDPSLNGFVVAYEYSAILDSATTEICRHLDEADTGNHDMAWYESNPRFRPPNHFNCRSLLIPVTEADEDTFVEGDQPSVEPQDGFR